MANRKHLQILRGGVGDWNTWRNENPSVNPDLRAADLCKANLLGVDLSDADLTDANLSGANLSKADLMYARLAIADLHGANLSNAILAQADLSGVDLSKADLSTADLRAANLHAPNIQETQFMNAICEYTQFDDVDLSTARGLETITHNGPSTIGIDTLYKSGGNIPREFLEGCGVPDVMIEFAKSLVGKAIEYYSCFISHSSQDAAFCNRLYERMRTENLRVWYAPEDMKGGKKVYTQIDEAIRLHDKLIIVLSEASMNSKWVRVEIQRALRREKAENRRVLFPITLVDYKALQNWDLVASDGHDLAEEIREYYVPDFSQWKDHDQFMVAFQRLLADLRKND